MGRKKVFLSFSTAIFITLITAQAEENVNSTQVQVVKNSNGNQTVVYTGALNSYDNGTWANIELEAGDFMVVFDWDSDDEFYITPITGTESNMNMNINTSVQNMHMYNTYIQQNSSTVSENTIKTNVALMYDNTYYENILIPGETLTVPVTITNTDDTEKEISSYIAVYDLSGKLTDVVSGNTITVSANTSVTSEITKEFSADTASTAKIMLWDKATMKPVSDAIELTVQNCDYYPDNLESALEIDFDNPVYGAINTTTDIDILKFTPERSDNYIITAVNSTNVKGDLYNSELTLLASSDIGDSDVSFRITSEMTADEEYYIVISPKSGQTGTYTLYMEEPFELISIE